MSKDDLLELVYSYVEEAIEILVKKTGKRIKIEEIELSGRLSRTLAYAVFFHYGKKYHFSITISSKIFKKDSYVLRETCFHEVAHLYDVALNKNWGHGDSWVKLMNLLGVPATVHAVPSDYEDA